MDYGNKLGVDMDFSDENVFITGITGFVGPYLADFLLSKDANIFGLMRKRADGRTPKNLEEAGILEGITLIEGDLMDITSLANAVMESEPDHIFHLAAQSYVPYSFSNPLEVTKVNSIGTMNLLEAVRLSDYDPSIVFAGSSEEYGLVITSEEQYERVLKERKHIFPKPSEIPEIPVEETNPLRPMSPYGVSKVYGDHIMRNYFHSYGMDTKVSRAFNHEGARRGEEFVTSTITKQVMRIKHGEQDRIKIGNINAFRDWSHVGDVIEGYCLISKEGKSGDVYNQGSNRINSVLSYILLSLEEAGYDINCLKTYNNEKKVENPVFEKKRRFFGTEFNNTNVDRLILEDKIRFGIEDEGIRVKTENSYIDIEFDEDRFRRAEVPFLLSNTDKIEKIGFEVSHSLRDIIRDQLNYYMDPERRKT